MTRPPLSTGAVHERLIWVVPLAVAVRLVGAPGAVGALAGRVELLVTAGTPPAPVVKDAASLPAVSWMGIIYHVTRRPHVACILPTHTAI